MMFKKNKKRWGTQLSDIAKVYIKSEIGLDSVKVIFIPEISEALIDTIIEYNLDSIVTKIIIKRCLAAPKISPIITISNFLGSSSKEMKKFFIKRTETILENNFYCE